MITTPICLLRRRGCASTEHKQSRSDLFLLSIFCASLLSGCWGGVDRSVLATVLSVEGEVLYQAKQGDPVRPLTADINPAGGALLSIADNAQVRLALLPGTLLHVSADSEVRIEELRLTKQGNETDDGMRKRVARLRLTRGKIDIVFERRDDSEVRFSVVTPAVTVTVDEDSIWHTDVDKDKTRLTCVRGKIHAQTGNQEPAIVKAGYFQEWPGGAPALAAENAQAQGDVSDALEAARALQQLQRAHINRRPF